MLSLARARWPACGYLTLHPGFETEFSARGAQMGDGHVAPAHRRQGLGRALMAAAARLVRDEGGAFLWWTALPGHAAGQAVSLKRGTFGVLADGA